MQFLAVFIHNLEKVPKILEPNAIVNLEATCSSDLALGRVSQCGIDVLHPFRVLVVWFGGEIWSTFREIEFDGHFDVDGGEKRGMGFVFIVRLS